MRETCRIVRTFRNASHSTMSSTRSTDDETRSVEQEQAVKLLNEALDVEKADEKDYHVRQALQLLALEDE